MIEGETKELVAEIKEIRDWMGCGVIVIDHDLSFITTVCERIYVLDMGRLVAAGPPSVLRDDPKVAEIYLGRKARRRAAQAAAEPSAPM
jgi:branched-chain amino acid transport system ATP-binding protein